MIILSVFTASSIHGPMLSGTIILLDLWGFKTHPYLLVDQQIPFEAV